MSNFTARTRLRGDTIYYAANWLDGHFEDGKYGVLFTDGKYKGRIFSEDECAMAKDDAHFNELSLCKNCWCMTRTLNGRCGKCKAKKNEQQSGEIR